MSFKLCSSNVSRLITSANNRSRHCTSVAKHFQNISLNKVIPINILFRVAYNSIGAGSLINNLHFQLIYS